MEKLGVKKLVCNDKIVDKGILKFICDVLYLKEIIYIEEYDDIMDCSTCEDLDDVFENMMLDMYRDYGRGDMQWELKDGTMLNY